MISESCVPECLVSLAVGHGGLRLSSGIRSLRVASESSAESALPSQFRPLHPKRAGQAIRVVDSCSLGELRESQTTFCQELGPDFQVRSLI